jgi:serine protease SohB
MTNEGTRDRFLRLIAPLLPSRYRAGIPIVPVVRLTGVIGFTTPLRPGLTLSSVARALERAFKVRRARAVALAINSPGGSAVQAHLIHRRIRQLAKEKNLPVIAFIEDVAASGGYMLACAADEVICDQSSIVGSIGVIGATFGFQKLLDRIGVERRVYTSGERKLMLDPFLPENPEDVQRLKAIQAEIHERFIALVKESRGARLNGPDSALFSGEFWVGGKARELGLVDGLGDLRGVLRERFGEKVLTPLVVERGFLGRTQPGVGGGRFEPANFADDLVSALETRAMWARYGL